MCVALVQEVMPYFETFRTDHLLCYLQQPGFELHLDQSSFSHVTTFFISLIELICFMCNVFQQPILKAIRDPCKILDIRYAS